MEKIKHFPTRLDCLIWLDDHYGEPAFEDAECIHVDRHVDGWVTTHRWAIQLRSGEYVAEETA